MYGSIHTHFESGYDTANKDFKVMLQSFQAVGAQKVAVTDHGVFSAYEDAVTALQKLQEEEMPASTLELIPGVEGYFSFSDEREKTSHIVLLAKDYEGYQSLCKIITQSNKDFQTAKGTNGKPVITLKNLEENVAKGHLFCTTACIAGILGSRFGLERISLEEKTARQVEVCAKQPLDEAWLISPELLKEKAFAPLRHVNYAAKDKPPALVKDLIKRKPKTEAEALLYRYELTKANWAMAEALRKEKKPKTNAQYGVNPIAMEYYETRKAYYETIREYQEKKPKNVLFTTLKGYIEALEQFPTEAETERACRTLYHKLLRIFGKEYFYFELQNHGLEQEAILYPRIVAFAKSVKNETHFIASNDIHIGVSKAFVSAQGLDWNTVLEKEVICRDVIRFTRFNRFLYDDDTIHPDEYEYYIKDDAELREWISRIIPDTTVLDNAFANVEKVLSQCHVAFPERENHYPSFCENPDERFDVAVKKGIRRRFPNGFPKEVCAADGTALTGADYEKRVAYESEVIKQMGYASYHLIVADYLEFGRKLGSLPDSVIQSDDCPLTMEELDAYLDEHQITPNAYSIGPGRGSAVGSIVCYLLGITDIDPLQYGLLFERYLNPERISMPDIDADFKPDIRDRCIEFCKRKFGYDKVCSISTKSYAEAKGAIKIAGRYIGTKAWLHSPQKREADEALQKNDIKKKEYEEREQSFLGNFYRLADGLCKAVDAFLKKNPKGDFFTGYCASADEKRLLSVAALVQGCFTNYGQHAAGTIISKDAITNTLPLMYSEGKENMETQCNMEQAEAKGYLKMDFLVLKNLAIITNIMRRTGDMQLLDCDKRNEILNDKRIYENIYATGLTQGVFQMESPGMKAFLQQFQPESFEDVILLNAAYRPGPMQFLPEIIAEKWYRKAVRNSEVGVRSDGSVLWNGQVYEKPKHSIQIDCPALNEILASTYGCIIYQEQIMQICQRVAGFSMARADNVRKYMSKKKEGKLVAERPDFISGCRRVSRLSETDANVLFDAMIDFAKYAFNKSHACAYAVVSVITAYLKQYHPAAFFAESLNAVGALDEILDFTMEIPAFGLRLLPPDLQKSENRFTCLGNDIYYGLGYIKGLSGVSYRKAPSFMQFIVENRETITEKTMVKLCKCGLFDSMEPSITRKDLCDIIPVIYKSLSNEEKLRKKLDECQSDVVFLTAWQAKARLSVEEKTTIAARCKFRKAADKVTRKDIEKKLLSLQSQVVKTKIELRTEEGRLEQVLHVLRVSSRHTKESILFNRACEQELLGYVFDIRESLSVLEHCNTFPEGTMDCRNRVDRDIPNLGLIVLNPCVKRTPAGWVKVLCCDKNRVYKHLYFKDYFPTDITEFALTFKEEKLQERRENKDGKTNSNNMYVAPYAYAFEDIGYRPNRHIYVESRRDWQSVIQKMELGRPFHATAYFHCAALDYLYVPCKADIVEDLLKENEIDYAAYEEK